MHMADALLSPAVGGTMLAVSAGVLACSIRDIRKNFQESRIPLMGVAGAFVFSARTARASRRCWRAFRGSFRSVPGRSGSTV